jgi:hypothetical protein
MLTFKLLLMPASPKLHVVVLKQGLFIPTGYPWLFLEVPWPCWRTLGCWLSSSCHTVSSSTRDRVKMWDSPFTFCGRDGDAEIVTGMNFLFQSVKYVGPPLSPTWLVAMKNTFHSFMLVWLASQHLTSRVTHQKLPFWECRTFLHKL